MNCDDRFGLRPVWDAILSVYDEVSRLCEKHGLRYYVSDGAALGSVRRGCFIPWDDDLDISMPREDYEKFKLLAKTELPSHLKFVNWENTTEFPLLFGKVQDARESSVRLIEKKVGRMLSNGIYVDIFPIDGYPTGWIAPRWIKIRDSFLMAVERFHLYKYSRLSKKGKVAWIAGMLLSVFVFWLRSQRQFLALHEKTLKRYPYAGSRFVGRTCQRMNPFRREALPKEVWGVAMEGDLNGRRIKLPENVTAYLINEYGSSYMTPPPPERQKLGHSYSWRCPWWLGPTGEKKDGG